MSLKQIADHLGISPSTVSRVLNNTSYNCASPELKDKIWAAAKKFNYIPNESARNLKKGAANTSKKYSITIILGRFHTIETDPFFKELFRYVEEELFSNDCIVKSITTSDVFLSENDYSSDGYLILGRCPEALLTQLKKHTKNIVGVGRNPTNFDIDEIICDGKAAAMLAMEHLISLGHTKIAYIGDCSYETRYIGYCECMMKHGFPIDYSFIRATNQTAEEAREVMKDLYPSLTASAILCANDATAIGVLSYLNEHARKDFTLSVISIDNIKEAEECTPFLTTVNIPAEDMGHTAVRILINRIRHKQNEFLRVEFPCRLIIRDSCKKAGH